MDILSVIMLGHTSKLPLMCLSSELVDGFEPHSLIYSWDTTRAPYAMTHRAVREGVPGVAVAGYWEGGYTGYSARARLRVIPVN